MTFATPVPELKPVKKLQIPAFYECRGGVIDRVTHRTVLRLDRNNLTDAQAARVMDTVLAALNAEFDPVTVLDLRRND